MKKAMNLKKVELEIIFLKAVSELINEMVNYEILAVTGNNSDSEVRFNSATHQKYFNIMLVDFLSCAKEELFGKKQPYLGALREICEFPSFGSDASSLREVTKKFVEWLEKEVFAENIRFPSIALECSLSIKRIEFIKICGNISKHNFSRLPTLVEELIRIFERNNISITVEESLLIIGDFYEWFHVHIFSYHSSAIAEFLNNIRWGIYEYLRPEFNKSIVFESEEHHWIYPSEVINLFAKNCFQELMNEMRSEPFMEKFQVTRFLKMRY